MQKYFFHNKLVFLISVVVSTTAFFGCFNLKKAIKQQEKIAKKFPELVVSKANKIAPTQSNGSDTVVVIDSSRYFIAVAEKERISALNKDLTYKLNNALNKLPEVVVKGCEDYEKAIDLLQIEKANLQAQLSVAPSVIYRTTKITDTIIDSKGLYLKQKEVDGLNVAINDLKNENENLLKQKKAIQKNYYILWAVIIAIIALYIFVKKYKSKLKI
jgi:hypothetical protein